MKHRNRFLATLLSLSMVATTVFPGAIVTARAEETEASLQVQTPGEQSQQAISAGLQEAETDDWDEDLVAESAENKVTLTLDIGEGAYFSNLDEEVTTKQIIGAKGASVYLMEYGTPMYKDQDKIFKGWSTSQGGDVLENSHMDLPDSDLTLYAVWADAVKVKFHKGEDNEPFSLSYNVFDGNYTILDNERAGDTDYYSEYTLLIEKGAELNCNPTVGQNQDKILTGWKDSESDEVYCSYEIPVWVNETTDLYPVWKKAYKITIETIEEGTSFNTFWWSSYGKTGCSIRIDDTYEDGEYRNPTKVIYLATEGYEFTLPDLSEISNSDPTKALLGFSPDGGGQVYSAGSCIIIHEDMEFSTVYGTGIPVSFDANGGSINGKGTFTAAFAEGVEFYPSNCVRPNWTDDSKVFIGWTTERDDESSQIWGIKPQDITLYALYKDKTNVTVNIPNGKIRYNDYAPEEDEEFSTVTLSGVIGEGFSVGRSEYSNKNRWYFCAGYGDYRSFSAYPDNEQLIPYGFHIGSEDGEFSQYPTVTKDMVLYLNWAEGCKIDLDLNGGKVQKSNGNYDFFYQKFDSLQPKGATYASLDLTYEGDYQGLIIPPSEDQVFAGWTTVKDDPQTMLQHDRPDLDENLTTLTDDVTLYAYYADVSNVTFDANGGYFGNREDESTYTTKIVSGENIGSYQSIPNHLDENLSFAGWSREKGGEIEGDIWSMVADGSPLTLYAVWVSAKTITFDANGGYFIEWDSSKGEDVQILTRTVKVPAGHTVGSVRWIEDPYPSGDFFFNGWYLSKKADGSDAPLINDSPWYSYNVYDYKITEDVIATADWSPAVTVTFDANEKGSFDPEGENLGTRSVTRKKGSILDQFDIYGDPEDPSGNYLFKGWSLSKNGPVVDDYWKLQIEEDTTVYAVWSHAATIILNANGVGQWRTGWIDRKKKIAKYGDSITITGALGDPLSLWLVEPGYYDSDAYKFEGWSKTEDGELIDDKTELTGDIELFAIWKPVTRVTFHPNGGKLVNFSFRTYAYNGAYGFSAGDTVSETYFSEDSIAAVKQTDWYADRDEYGFAGWSTTEGDDAAPVDANSYKMGNSPNLYAAWTKDYYTANLNMGEYVYFHNEQEWVPDSSVSENGIDEIEDYYNAETGEYGYWTEVSHCDQAKGDDQIKTIRLSKGSSLKNYLDGFGSYRLQDPEHPNSYFALKGFSETQGDGVLINPDRYLLDKDVTLYAIYEDTSSVDEMISLREDEEASKVPQNEQETKEKAEALVDKAVEQQTTTKKKLSDIKPCDETSTVQVKAINEVKDQKVIDSLKEVLVAVMDAAKDEDVTVQSVQLFDMDATGSGRISIYVGKGFAGLVSVVGHYHNGEWTTQQCKVDENGYVSPSFNSFSPISISILNTTNVLSKALPTKDEKDAEETVIVPTKDEKPENKPEKKDADSKTVNPNSGNNNSGSKITAIDVGTLTVSLSKETFNYNGKVQVPKVSVKTNAGKALAEGTDYTITVNSGKKVGNYSIVVTGKGGYTGSKTLTYQVIPKNATSLKAKADGTKIKVTWKKQTKETSGYEVQYADNKKFKKATTQKIKKNKTTSVLLKKKIKKGKTYFVRIRSFKTVSGKKIYSTWSKAKKVKIKK